MSVERRLLVEYTSRRRQRICNDFTMTEHRRRKDVEITCFDDVVLTSTTKSDVFQRHVVAPVGTL